MWSTRTRTASWWSGPIRARWAACASPSGAGVCGAAAETRQTQLVPDVHAFPGHIACDSRSASEIVVPVFDAKGALIAVFDVDSTEPAAFDETDAQWLEKILRDTFLGLTFAATGPPFPNREELDR